MIKRFKSTRYSLTAQLVLSFIALVILTAAAVGLPSIWLIRSQLERQAWAQVEQGSGTARALFAARQSHLDNLALLTAQRPTLLELLEQGAAGGLAGLPAYLETLQSGAGLDFILVCAADGQPLAASGLAVPGQVCKDPASPYRSVETQGDGSQPASPGSASTPRAWLVAGQAVSPASPTLDGMQVVVGQALDREFVQDLSVQTGLEQTLVAGGELVATSFEDPGRTWPVLSALLAGDLARTRQDSFLLDGAPYYAILFALDESGLENLVALPATGLLEAQRQLTRTAAAGILAVALLGSLLGVFLSRRVGQPLARLGQSAVALRNGDLATPVSVRSKVPEVALVANAMEDARVALHHTIAELRQEKAWVENLLESIVEGIVTLDQHGRITFFSHGAEQISGWNQAQAIRRSINEVFHPAEENSTFIQLLPPAGRRQKIAVNLPGGRQATLSVTGARLAPPEAGKARVVLVMRDVSDEEAIRRLLGDFLANIAHEFRTPLSALDASIELLVDQLPDLSQAELEELLGSLHLGVLSLQTLIDNLLEGASIETGHFRVYPHPSPLDQVVYEAARVMQPLLEKYRQQLVLDLPDGLPQVQADPRRTGQVLVNLLSNAIKHSPPEAEIRLIVCRERQEIRVQVMDRGPGIPRDQQADLFRRFAHVQPGSERAEYGAGLGLSVVKAIVDAQGGQVGVSDRPGGGAVFWFTLPLAQAAEEEAAG